MPLPVIAQVPAAVPDNLPGIVDRKRLAVPPAQIPQVGHRAVRPKKRVGLAGGGQAGAHDLPGVVDAGGATARPTQRAEIGDHAILPPAGAPGSGAARANDLAGVIYRGHGDLTDIGHHAVRPHEAVHLAGGRLAVACNLAGVVDVTRRATGSAQRAEIRGGAALPDAGVGSALARDASGVVDICHLDPAEVGDHPVGPEEPAEGVGQAHADDLAGVVHCERLAGRSRGAEIGDGNPCAGPFGASRRKRRLPCSRGLGADGRGFRVDEVARGERQAHGHDEREDAHTHTSGKAFARNSDVAERSNARARSCHTALRGESASQRS